MNAAAKVVDLAVTAVRLPVTVAEKVVGEPTVASLPPVRVLNAAQAFMLSASGTVLGDEELVARGSLLRAAAARRTEAARLESVADERRAEADAAAQARLDEAEALRESAADAADAQRRKIAAGKQAKKRAAKQTMQKKAATVDRIADAQEQRLEADERAARRSALVDERRALDEERKAAEAQRRADALADKVDESKASRRSR